MDDLNDTASSPLKPYEEGGRDAQKKDSSGVRKELNMEEGDERVPPPPPQYVPPKERKKQKNGAAAGMGHVGDHSGLAEHAAGDQANAKNITATEAASTVEDRRAQ